MNPTFFVAGGYLSNAAGDSVETVPFIEMDSTVELTTEFAGQVTSHPVGSGARITDHFTRENPRFVLRGVTSNTPVLVAAQNNKTGVYGKRTKNTYDVLRSMYYNAAVFTLVCDLDSYPNCIISNFGFTQNAQQAESLHVDLQIEQLRVVSSQRVAAIIPNMNPVVAEDSTEPQRQGTKSGVEKPDFVLFPTIKGDR